MLIVHSYYPKEYAQMVKWLTWAVHLGGAKKHKALFVEGDDTTQLMHEHVAKLAEEVYGSVDFIRTFYTDPRPWPVNANLSFQRAARHISENIKTPWMWCEADCIPLKPRWWDIWEEEYNRAGKPFMGHIVSHPAHLTGNAVYPPDVAAYNHNALLVETVAWDVVDQDKVLKHTYHTPLYCHRWHYNVPEPASPGYSSAATHFDSLKDLEIIPQECVLFHRNKDGSLIDQLEVKRGLDERNASHIEAIDPSKLGVNPEKVQERLEMDCGILIRTYAKDEPWLHYCLASIKKYGSGFKRIKVVTQKFEKSMFAPICKRAGVEYSTVENDACSGYIAQQITKLEADKHLPDCKHILHIDSDTMFYRLLTPNDLLAGPDDQRIEVYCEKYEVFKGSNMPWQKPTEEAVGKPVLYEFMRRHPFTYPAWIYQKAREHLEERFKVPWDKYVASRQVFSEFNFLGAFAHEFHHDAFKWTELDKANLPKTKVREFRSWDGITPAVQKELDAILT
jgi:hypothetical protein